MMKKSYRKLDYRIRPAKHVERLMLAETFKRSRFCLPHQYQYIGMGSLYFADFHLFHKALGFEEMHSIEKEKNDEERFRNNVPFRNVNLIFEETGTALSKLDFSKRSIVWLDYDGRLSGSVLEDVRDLTSSVCSGSFILFTVQANPENGDDKIDSLQLLAKEVGEKNVPAKTKKTTLYGWGTAQVLRQIIANEIESSLSTRNLGQPDGQSFCFKQLFNFNYEDGAKMLTVGGIVYSQAEVDMLEACKFDELTFVETEKTPFKITVPNLTFRELKLLESQMPTVGLTDLDKRGMPDSEITNYMKIYRYFPSFATFESA